MSTDQAPRRRTGGRSARARAAVLQATVAELLEVGYARLRLESVAERAGVHRTTVYRRWPDRQDLVLEALLDQRDADVPVPDTGSLREDLRRLAHSIVRTLTSPVGAALARTMAAQSGPAPAIARFWAERLQLAGVIVARAVERGELPPGTDPQLLIEAMVGPLYLRLLYTARPLTPAYADQLVDLLLEGVASAGG
jgi:AcrR family transcriptional regulator